jgi:putative membrane protein
MNQSARTPPLLLAATVIAIALSALHPHDYFTWFMEVVPIFIGLPILILTYKRFPLTPLLYWLFFFHALILMVGGHWTYAQVPAGFRVQEWLGLDRNPYDRLGHFAQGFVPAILARELLLRTSPLRPGKWLFAITLFICLGFSAFYELFEWATALATGSKADDFLGTQGDPWDTQWDMFTALIGSLTGQVALGKWHLRQLGKLSVSA